MQMIIQPKLKRVSNTLLFFLGAWIVFHLDIIDSKNSGMIPDLPTAAAAAQYGIQGQQAPEFNLTTWIDGNGMSIDPVKLNDHREKVIYLYFFQDW